MKTRWWLRLGAVLAALALVAAACGDDDGDGGEAATTTTEEEQADIEANPATDRLVIGRILPETGSLAFLGPPMIAGVNLALEDVNASGGVLGQPVDVLEADEGDDAARATESLARVLAEGANAIVGAAASGQTQEIIQTLFDEQIPECSPSNTSPAFSDQDNAGFYFRTVPPDQAVAPVFADKLLADGRSNVALVARQDDYGQLLLEETSAALQERGATVSAEITYDPDTSTFDSEIEEISAASPDAVVVISFSEGGPLVRGLIEEGFSPDQLYGGDGVFGPTFGDFVDEENPGVVNGMVVIGAAGGVEFNDRLDAALPADEKGNLIYGGQSYDCVVVLALAAEQAGSLDGQAMMDAVFQVTSEGEECATFADCKAAIEAGQDIQYRGSLASGFLNLDEVGDPTAGRYAIAVLGDRTLAVIGQQDVVLSELEG
jgi:ABC-type branched-subunit amino acid transport system substrate-binding protein